jgi:tellurite resistance protein TerC
MARKAVVTAVGLSVLGFGVALIVLPAPSSIVILLGLAILATEFLWVRKPLLWIRSLLGRLRARVGNMLSRRSRSASRKVQR